MANLVNDAALHLGLRKDSMNRIFEAGEPIDTGNKDIFDSRA
jgi:hypothetical protein